MCLYWIKVNLIKPLLIKILTFVLIYHVCFHWINICKIYDYIKNVTLMLLDIYKNILHLSHILSNLLKNKKVII